MNTAAMLRQIAEEMEAEVGQCSEAGICRDAAAEIERLTAERDDAREQRRRWQEASVADRAEAHRLTAENKRLGGYLQWALARIPIPRLIRGQNDDHYAAYQSAQDALRAFQQTAGTKP